MFGPTSASDIFSRRQIPTTGYSNYFPSHSIASLMPQRRRPAYKAECERQTYVKHRLALTMPRAAATIKVLQKRRVSPLVSHFCQLSQPGSRARRAAAPGRRAAHHRIVGRTAIAFVPWRPSRCPYRQSANDAAARPYFFGICGSERRQFGRLRESVSQKRQKLPYS